MKSLIKTIFLFFLPVFSMSQQNPYWQEPTRVQADSLRLLFQKTSNDSLRMYAYRELGLYYQEIQRDSSLYFYEQSLLLAQKLKLKLWEAEAFNRIGYISVVLGNYPRSLKTLLQALKIAKSEESENHIWRISKFSKERKPRIARLTVLAAIHDHMGVLYLLTGEVEKQVANLLEALKIAESIDDKALLSLVNMNLGEAYKDLNKLDSALIFEQKAFNYSNTSGYRKYKGMILLNTGAIYFNKGNYDSAKRFFAESIKTNQEQSNLMFLGMACVSLANLFTKTGVIDSGLFYAKKGLHTYQTISSPEGMLSAFTSLSSIYKLQNNLDSAFFFQGLAMAAKDSLNNAEKNKQFQNIGFDEQLRQQELEKEKINYQNKIRTYSLLAGILVFLFVTSILYRNNKQKQKANKVLEKTLSDLKATQSQLIQSEKMASLGELTAGIAHEIQNPLNFVNNFSDVNKELIAEMKDEIKKGNLDEVNIIAKDIEDNEEKINLHGKRADVIVKGMLQHSRSSSGVKEPTDINKLADEYLRLAYHGLRSKDNSFNATLKTDFDESLSADEAGIGNINIIPQEIGRVLLNLYNNAFYAVTEKKKSAYAVACATAEAPGGTRSADKQYEPTVSVSTKKFNDKVEIRVIDNGNGISQKILEKIFQPFFTTKPTGQGTGLGLSLSYDIVKAHGGEIKVETKEREGTEFIVLLPA